MRVSHTFPLLLALLSAGCMFGRKTAGIDEEQKKENTRAIEQRRLRAIENGDVASKRGAEILVIDPYKTFDPSRTAVGGRTYSTEGAHVKEFYYDQKTHPGIFGTRDFYGSKKAWAGEMKFATRDASTTGKHKIPNATSAFRTKTAATKPASDAGKTAPVKGLADGKREFLGKESKKLRTAVDPATMGDWRSEARESVIQSDSTVEKFSTLKPLSIDDIRELLNKNK